jgi:hypothetical protein
VGRCDPPIPGRLPPPIPGRLPARSPGKVVGRCVPPRFGRSPPPMPGPLMPPGRFWGTGRDRPGVGAGRVATPGWGRRVPKPGRPTLPGEPPAPGPPLLGRFIPGAGRLLASPPLGPFGLSPGAGRCDGESPGPGAGRVMPPCGSDGRPFPDRLGRLAEGRCGMGRAWAVGICGRAWGICGLAWGICGRDMPPEGRAMPPLGRDMPPPGRPPPPPGRPPPPPGRASTCTLAIAITQARATRRSLGRINRMSGLAVLGNTAFENAALKRSVRWTEPSGRGVSGSRRFVMMG